MVKVATHRFFLFLIGALLATAGARAQCPPAASCTPGPASNSNAQFIQAGIYSVRIGNNPANVSSGYSEGYVDNSCTIGATLIQGDHDSLVINTGAQVDENVRVYIDWNNNGTFDAATELVLSSNGAKVHRGIITEPANVILGQKLRVRIAADANISVLPTPCSTPEYSQTEDYFILIQANTAPPIANFFTTDTLTCSGTATFHDQSSGSPTSWDWTFGDGGTSQDQSPVHTYTGTGHYTVTLIATNANGSDTLVRPNYVYYNDTVPVAAACTPVTSAYCCGFGITRFTLKNENGASLIDKSSANGSAGYENFTCTIRAKLIEGRPYSVALETNPSQVQNTKIWIDFNDNGTFDEPSELVFSSTGEINPTDTFTVQGGASVVRNRPLRMRVLSDGGTATLTACTNPQLGQAEDYTVVLLENTLPPIANFSRQGGSGCDSVSTFIADAENIVSEYIWNFGDGQSDTTTTATVSHEYADYGLYTVTLVAVGPFGRDTLVKQNLVSFIQSPAPALCAAPTGQSCCQIGIRRVQLADIDMASGDATEGYQDFTCQATTTLKKSRAYPITVTTGANNPEMVGIWIDWNNDHNFTDDERVFSNTGVATHTGSLPAMPATVVMNTALRMRVASGAQQGGPGGGDVLACGQRNFGQAEDYTVVVVQNLDPPIARFSSPRSTCNGSISFTDSSQNEVNSWLWRFGDGDTSTQQNPTHIYTAPGTYSVSLVVRNSFGADSIEKTNYITVYSDLNLAPVSCQPAAQNANAAFGISRVRLNTIDNPSGNAIEGYKDFTCSQTTRLTKGSHYNLRVSFSTQNRENLRAWIDYNSNGTFETAEILGTVQQAADTALITFTVPGSGTEGRGLRMRILGDFAGNTVLDPCNNVQIGQVEDYTILLDSNVSAPLAAFGAQSRTSCNGFVQFLDSSNQVPTSYRWDFGDGTFSTLQNPVKKYTATGTYSVKLVVRNNFGVDSVIRQSYVIITGLDGVKPAACRPTRGTNNGPSGITRVQFSTLDNPSQNGLTVASEDFTCLATPELLVGTRVTVQFQVVRFNERIFGWIDWNNDSTFTSDELVISTLQNAGNQPKDTILVPGTAVRGQALRFRLISTADNTVPMACGTFNNGQMEEYSVIVNARPPIANFVMDGTPTCSGAVRFADSTRNGATSWYWTFGDGGFSTDQNPTHAYAPGTYTVKLVVTNPVGRDSIERMNFVTVVPSHGPKAPVCVPTSTLTQNSITGMTSVMMSNLNRTSTFTQTSAMSTEGYRDFSCSDSIKAMIGDRISITINQTGANRPQVVAVFLDANNDGAFATNEQVTVGNLPFNQAFSGAFTVPSTLQDTVKYRIRVIARVGNGPANTCAVTDGQAEDYMLVLLPTAVRKPLMQALHAYPNPAGNSVKISLPTDLVGAARAEIIDGTGRTVLTRSVSGSAAGTTVELTLTDLPQGFYTLRLTTTGTLYTAPLSIVR